MYREPDGQFEYHADDRRRDGGERGVNRPVAAQCFDVARAALAPGERSGK